MPAPLESFLRLVTSGNNVLDDELYQSFGGESILDALRQYDPDAHFTDTMISEAGNEAGTPSGKMGKRLDFDWSKLPKSKAGSDFSINPSGLHDQVLDSSKVYDDPVYGKVTNSGNFAPDKTTALEIIGPLLVSLGAPMVGGALAGAGIGGAAGLTAGVTGSGLGGAASVSPLTAGAIKTLPSVARSIDQNGGFDPASLGRIIASYGASAAGLSPYIVPAITTLASLAGQRKR